MLAPSSNFLLLIEMCHHKQRLSDRNTSARYDSCRMKIVRFMYKKDDPLTLHMTVIAFFLLSC